MPDVENKDQELNDLRLELTLTKRDAKERDISNDLYARKIVERIVFGTVIILALAALFFIFTKVGLPIPTSL